LEQLTRQKPEGTIARRDKLGKEKWRRRGSIFGERHTGGICLKKQA